MIEKRWPWFMCGGLLVTAGVAAGVTTYFWWLPCQGQMLNGVVILSNDAEYRFSDACLERMDTGSPLPGPGFPEGSSLMVVLALVSMVLAGLACLLPAYQAPFTRPRRLLLALPSILTVIFGATVLIDLVPVTPPDGLVWGLIHALGLSIVVALMAVMRPQHSRQLWRWVVALGALSSFTMVGVLTDYIPTSTWNDANWDTPPGGGYPTAGWLLVCGLVIIALTVGRDGSAAESQDVTERADRVVLLDTPPA